MPTNPTQQWIPPDIQAQMLEQQKKQLMAQAMLGAVQPTQPQMVGGRYIGGGLLGAATPMAKALIGAKQGEQQLQSQADMIRAMAGKYALGDPAKLAQSGKWTPQSVNQYATDGNGNNVKPLPKPEDLPTGKTRPASEPGFIQTEYMSQDNKPYWKTIRGPSSITQNNGKEDQQAKEEAKHITTDFTAKADMAIKSAQSLPTIAKAKKLLDGDMTAGFGANVINNGKAFFSQVFGLPMESLDDAQEYQALVQSQLASIVKAVGGPNVSDTDVKVAMGIIGADITKQKAAMKRILSDLEDRANMNLKTYDAASSNHPGGKLKNYFDSQVAQARGLSWQAPLADGMPPPPNPDAVKLEVLKQSVDGMPPPPKVDEAGAAAIVNQQQPPSLPVNRVEQLKKLRQTLTF